MSTLLPARRPRVWVGRVASYDRHLIRVAVARGLDAVGADPGGNLVGLADWAGPGPAAHTRPEVVDAALDVLFARRPDSFLVLTGRGRELPTRHVLRRVSGATRDLRAGYSALPSLHPGRLALRPGEEAKLYRYQLSVGERTERARALDPGPGGLPGEHRASDRETAGWELYHADAVVAFPRLAMDPLLGGPAGAMALAAEATDPDFRPRPGMGGHLARRLVDRQEAVLPDLIITDAVEVGFGGARTSQAAHALGLLIVANDAFAHDLVCAWLLGLDPAEVPWLRLAAERGYGALDLAAVDLETDLELEEVRERLAGLALPPSDPGPAGLVLRYEQLSGRPSAFRVHLGGGPDDGSEAILHDVLAGLLDEPRHAESLGACPPLGVVARGRPPEEGEGGLVLLGDSAVAATLRAPGASYRTVFELPPARAARFGLPRALHRLHLGGGSRWALEVPGNPPDPRALRRALMAFSRGRLRRRADGFPLRLLAGVDRLVSALRRVLRNREGIPVVHARKIRRLADAPIRLRWGTPALLAPRRLPAPAPVASEAEAS